MDSKKLKLYIRKIIKEELSSIFKENIRENIRENLIEILSNDTVRSTNNSNRDVQNKQKLSDLYTEESPTKSNKSFVKYTSNELLNTVLNETTGGIPNEGSMVQLSEGFNSVGNTNSITEIVPGESEVTKNIKENIFNRDFSSLMKAIDKKKSEKLGKLNE